MPLATLACLLVVVLAACTASRVSPPERTLSLAVAGFVQAEGIT